MKAVEIDLSSIKIEHIIVHDIPKHVKGDLTGAPVCSEHESTLTVGMKSFFKDKVVQALGSDKAHRVCFDSQSESATPVHTLGLLKEPHNFIQHSKAVAEGLYKVQVGTNAGGILVVMLGTINTYPSCFILKLERDKGARLTIDEKTRTLNIEEVQNIMLTQKTKIYKVAMFISRNDFKTNFDGLIMDYQIDLVMKKDITTWFMSKFLGCMAFEDPKVTTKKFHTLTRSYINTIEDIVERAKYLQDLNSYLGKNTSTINPKEFADDYLSIERKDSYKTFMEMKNFRFGSFSKDLTQIERHIKKITVLFENEISIIGKKGTFGEKVKLINMEDGKTKAEIVSKIKRID